MWHRLSEHVLLRKCRAFTAQSRHPQTNSEGVISGRIGGEMKGPSSQMAQCIVTEIMKSVILK